MTQIILEIGQPVVIGKLRHTNCGGGTHTEGNRSYQ